MYIQITTRCNMTCEHCGFACTDVGEDMTRETFKNALMWTTDIMTIGGGEPTIHPLFWDLMGLSLGTCDEVGMVTNGKETDTALALAGLARRGVIFCDLSQDCFHDEIDYKVVEAFQTSKGPNYTARNDGRSIRDTSAYLVEAGRCTDGREGCICEGLFCAPNGNVKACGCMDAPIFGNVNSEVVIPENYEYECWKQMEVSVDMAEASEVFNNAETA